MQLTFYGAAREVTGSMHLLSANSDCILLDCGLFQGKRKESNEKNKVMPIDPSILTNVVLSHAHIDHTGRLPLLSKNGFVGRIISTRATVDACRYLLHDSAYIQESDAEYLNYKMVRHVLSELMTSEGSKKLTNRQRGKVQSILKKKGHRLNSQAINDYIDKFSLRAIEPLYTTADAEQTIEQLDGYPYRQPISIGKNISCTFYEAGHILGSAMSLIKIKKNGHEKRIMYSGDIGRFTVPILRDPCLNFPEADRDIDVLIMESTYGNRTHDPAEDIKGKLQRVLSETFERGGTVLIPAFAFGRTQVLLYLLHELYNEGKVQPVPVYVDSPLASNLTKVFIEHPEVYDRETQNAFLKHCMNPFQFKELTFVSSVEESMAVNRQPGPQVVIAASGMCEAGRILHHLRHKIHNHKNTVLLVGYMAQHTLGSRIEKEGLAYEAAGRKGEPPVLRFYNKEYPLKARVTKIDGLSAHADRMELLRFLKQSKLRVKKIVLVHGEEEQSQPLAETLRREQYSVMVPKRGETLQVN